MRHDLCHRSDCAFATLAGSLRRFANSCENAPATASCENGAGIASFFSCSDRTVCAFVASSIHWRPASKGVNQGLVSGGLEAFAMFLVPHKSSK